MLDSLTCDVVLNLLSRFAIILLRKAELVALLQLCSSFHVGVCGLFLIPTMYLVGLWFVIVTFSNGIARTLKKLRTSKRDYCIKQ